MNSSPTCPKLRRSHTENDIEKGEDKLGEVALVANCSSSRDSSSDLRLPLLIVTQGCERRNGKLAPLPTKPRNNKLTLAICLVAAACALVPLFVWIAWCFVDIADESCPVQEWPYPDCVHHLTHKQGDAIPALLSPVDWRVMREKYQNSVEKSSFADGWEKLYKTMTTSTKDDGEKTITVPNTGFHVPIDFKYSPGKGRGVYATTLIKKGEQIWDSRFRGVFDSECSAKKFFAQLNNDEKCSAMFWGYSNNFYGHGFQFMTDMDGHGYFNHCSSKTSNSVHHFREERGRRDYRIPHFLSFSFGYANVDEETLRYRNQPGAHGLYASRDILPGEEICFDYAEIHHIGICDYFTKIFNNSLRIDQWMTK